MPFKNGSVRKQLMLQSRKKLIELILRQDKEIKQVFIEAGDQLAKRIRELEAEGRGYEITTLLDDYLRVSSEIIEERLKVLLDGSLTVSVESGLHQSKQTTLSLLKKGKMDWKPIERSYFRARTESVEAMKMRTIKGLNLSDRIWGQSQKARTILGSIVTEGMALGENPIQVAKMLEGYVRGGANTIASEYPNMMERMQYVPNDLSYEALRIARTESAAAYGEGTKRSAELNPSNVGMQWSLSNAGVACEKCKENADYDSGLGKGVYKMEDLPEYPAHPNCLCVLSEVVENTDDFVKRLIEWNNDPTTHADLEHWYQTQYKIGGL